MNYNDMPVEQQYFHDTAWDQLRLAYSCHRQNRKAKAQEHMREAMFFIAKVSAEFIEPELLQNIEEVQRLVFRGY